jgi:hypothetical protein
VSTNDPSNALIKLEISGNVEVFAILSPQIVRLTGSPDQELKASVTVTPSEKYDFTLTGHSVQSDTANVNVTIAPLETGEKGWVVSVTNVKKELGRYYDIIRLQTDSEIQPEIQVRIFGNIIHDGGLQTENKIQPSRTTEKN